MAAQAVNQSTPSTAQPTTTPYEYDNGISIAIDTADCAFTIAVNTTVNVRPAIARAVIAQLHASIRNEPDDVFCGDVAGPPFDVEAGSCCVCVVSAG